MRYSWCIRIYIYISIYIYKYVYIYISLQTTNISFNRNWCGNFVDSVERELLNYVFILHISFNNEPNYEIYLHHIKIFIHIHMYVFMYVYVRRKQYSVIKEICLKESYSYSVKSLFLLVPHMSCAYDWILCIT
jgi:hypothetical protein